MRPTASLQRSLIVMYCTMHELVRVNGKEKVLRIFFGPMPIPQV
jgi:hypothetical protein